VKRHEKYGRKVGNSEMTWKIWKNKIWNVKWYEKYGRKVSRTVIRHGQYRRKVSQIVKKRMKIWKKGKSNSEKTWKNMEEK
jgi:hypothetical protein